MQEDMQLDCYGRAVHPRRPASCDDGTADKVAELLGAFPFPWLVQD